MATPLQPLGFAPPTAATPRHRSFNPGASTGAFGPVAEVGRAGSRPRNRGKLPLRLGLPTATTPRELRFVSLDSGYCASRSLYAINAESRIGQCLQYATGPTAPHGV